MVVDGCWGEDPKEAFVREDGEWGCFWTAWRGPELKPPSGSGWKEGRSLWTLRCCRRLSCRLKNL